MYLLHSPIHMYINVCVCTQDMEKHGRLLACIQEIKQMLQTPIKPYSKPEEGEGGGRKGGRRRREVREERLTGKVGKADAAFSGDEDGGLCMSCDESTYA